LKAAGREHSLRALQEAKGVIGGLSGAAARHETNEAPLQNEKARPLPPRLMPISQHLPICRQSGFRTASSLQQTPLWPKRKTLFSFSDLADLCTVGVWLERGLLLEKV
jgi:hypothetical protein